MFDPIDPLLFFCCFPDDEEDVSCPHCQAQLTVPTEDMGGQEQFECCECGEAFTIDWDERKIYYDG